MSIQPRSRTTCACHRVSSTNRTKHAQTKTKGDDWPLCLTVVESLSLRTTSDLCYGAAQGKKSYRAALTGLVYRICTATIITCNLVEM